MNDQYHILVVDDEMSIRESLSAYLRDYDFIVTSTASAEEAIVYHNSEPYSLAIVDLRLPGMSGEELIWELHSKNPQMQFIVHTGSVEYVIPDTLKKIGVKPKQLFIKPVHDLAQIAKCIDSLLSEE